MRICASILGEHWCGLGSWRDERGMVLRRVSSCFRIVVFAHACCRIPGNLQTMATLGYNPLVAAANAVQGTAVEFLDQRTLLPGE